ncbi:MAG: lipopolysaccharide kinase InaA family protein [Myxococcota bacterium]
MATEPLQPIPDATQAHVDRLIGARVGEYLVLEKVGEGRHGTLYRGRAPASGQQAFVQVLRTGVTGSDQEVRAANSIKCSGIAAVFGFGEVADGRRYRVLEPLSGESLEQLLQRRGPLPAEETREILAKIARVLETAHAWAIAHGCLGASSVFLSDGSVKLIDYGLSRHPAKPEDDLKALGSLGFTLLTGQELDDRAPPPLGQGIPELLDRLLRELIEQRLEDATEARKELEGLAGLLDEPAMQRDAGARDDAPLTRATDIRAGARVGPSSSTPSKPSGRSGLLIAALAAVVLLGGGGVWWWLGQSEAPEQPGLNAENDDNYDFEAAAEEEAEAAEEAAAELPVVEQPGAPDPGREAPKPHTRRHKAVRTVPSVKALSDEIWRLEAKLRKQTKPGEDIDQALFMLNKQRLRLTGSPSVEDRKDVARQLAGWRRSYLRR